MRETPVFGLLSAFQASFLTLLLFLTVGIFNKPFNENSLYFSLICLLFIALESLYDLYLYTRPISSGNGPRKLRAALVLCVFLYVFLSLKSQNGFPENLLPDLFNTSGVFAFFMSAYLGRYYRSVLFSRRGLINLLKSNKNAALSDIFSRNAPLVFQAFQQAKELRNSALSNMASTLVLGITFGYTLGMPLLISVFFIASILSSLSILTVANSYLEEHRYYAQGIASGGKIIPRRQNTAYILLAVTFLVGAFSSQSQSFMTPERINEFFTWFFSFFQAGTRPETHIEAMKQFLDYYTPKQRPMLPSEIMGVAKPNPFLSNLFSILPGIIYSLGGLALIFFIFKPLIKRGFNLKTSLIFFFVQLLEFLSSPFVKAYQRIKVLFRKKPKKPAPLSLKDSISPERYMKALLKEGKKSRGLNTNLLRGALRIYFDFLEWIYLKGVRWVISDTPFDICRKTVELAKATAEKGDQGFWPPENQKHLSVLVKELTELLEKDLFSSKKLDSQELKKMRALLDEAQRTRVEKDQSSPG